MTELRELIKEYLRRAKLMQLATSEKDQPWVCSVWFAADDDLNLYWLSSITRRHSDEVMKNDRVAGAIVLPQTPEDPPVGIQFQGTAGLLTSKEDIEKAFSVYAGRIFPVEKIREFMASEEKPHRFYRIRPVKYVLFDTVNYPENSRRELVL